MPIDPQLQNVIPYLVSTEASIGQGTLGLEQRPWMNFDGITGSATAIGKFDLPGTHALFDRSASNDAYVTARQDTETKTMDIQTIKISADLLAGLERDYKMRIRSRIRMFVHASCRAAANGLDIGPLNNNSIGWLSRMLTAQETPKESE
jgi:hypothetical protein